MFAYTIGIVLDNHFNGEDSLENQERRLASLNKEKKKERTRQKYQQRRLEGEAEVEGDSEESGTIVDNNEPGDIHYTIQASDSVQSSQDENLNPNKESNYSLETKEKQLLTKN